MKTREAMKKSNLRRRTLLRSLLLAMSASLVAACGGGGSTVANPAASSGSSSNGSSGSSGSGSSGSGSTPPASGTKSVKRGVAYDLSDTGDFSAFAPGVSWWYNWAAQPNSAVPGNYQALYQMDYLPMLWNGTYDAATVESALLANPQIQYLLVMNEPNLVDQANLTPQQAAAIWPGYEAVAAKAGVKIVGPAMNWGTMNGYADPVTWLDDFYAAYRATNNRDPQIDYLAFHWYDYGLSAQLDRLTKYGKPFWVTEFANWHSQDDGAQIDTAAKQEAQMTDMVNTCETRSDVFRYAWFTGRMNNDVHYTSLLGGSGQLTALGQLYLSLPFQQA